MSTTIAPGVYLDNAATTRLDPRISALVTTLFLEEYGNAGSRTHLYGANAQSQLGRARERIAKALASEPDDVLFTSGATESDNLAILGVAPAAAAAGRRHIVSTMIEHKAVLEPLLRLESQGFEVTRVRPDARGHVAAAEVMSAVRPDTALVSVMHANNETGALQPIGAIADGLADDATLFHVDAAQTFGRLNAELRHPRIDLISLSAHKVFGPKGVGALIHRRRGGRRPALTPLMVGGGQERGLRPGTHPVPLIAGFGLAAELAEAEAVDREAKCADLRRRALTALAPLEPVIHGDPERGVLPNILSFAVPGIDSEAVMVALKGFVAISNGSACTSARYEPSHVLTAMELPTAVRDGTIRLSWAHDTPEPDWAELVRRLDGLRL